MARTTEESILEGLSESERQIIKLMVFIAHTDPQLHPIYGEA
jgi:hypothetical protein